MADTQRKLSGFVGEVRVSQYGTRGSGLQPPAGTLERIDQTSPEGTIKYAVPGLESGDFEIAHSMPQNVDLRRLQQIAADRLEVPVLFGDGTAVADFMTLGLGRVFGRDATVESGIPGFHSGGSMSTDWEPGECRWSDVGGVGITGATDGTGRQYVGGVAAGEKMVAVLIPWNRTGATPAVATAHWRSYSDSGYTTDQANHKTFSFSDTGGGLALRGAAAGSVPSGYYIELDGDSAAITNTYFRFEVSAITAGTWFFFGAVAHWTK